MTEPSALPDDVAALKATIHLLEERNQRLERLVEAFRQRLKQL